MNRCPVPFAVKFLFVLLAVVSIPVAAVSGDAAAATRYVDQNAPGAANGTSWGNAYTNLQDALVAAAPGDQIWVAAGVYYPDVGGGVAANDESVSFNVPSGVALYGGFAGGETQLNERDWTANVTVLSGDIDGNDAVDANGVVTTTTAINGVNSDHVLFLDGTTTAVTADTIIDGFTVTAGQADGSFPANAGGGLFCDGAGGAGVCSPALTNLVFSGNAANFGGAVLNLGSSGGSSSPTLTNVTFSGNAAANSGGAMYNNGPGGSSSPTLTNVAFIANEASFSGGALYSDGRGSGSSSPTLTNVIFSGNAAGVSGGAMTNYAPNEGDSSPVLTNVTFSGNAAVNNGGAMYSEGGGFPVGTVSVTLANVILWQNSASIGSEIRNQRTTVAFHHTIVEGGVGGSGISNDTFSSVIDNGNNLAGDPLFFQAVDPAAAPTSTGDLRLQPGSPAIDAGFNGAIPAGVTTDLTGNPRIINGTVDIGAYEAESAPSAVNVRSVSAGAASALPPVALLILISVSAFLLWRRGSPRATTAA